MHTKVMVIIHGRFIEVWSSIYVVLLFVTVHGHPWTMENCVEQ